MVESRFSRERRKAREIMYLLASVRLFVCALPAESFDIRGLALLGATRCNKSHYSVHTPSSSDHWGMVLTSHQSPLDMLLTW